jgi:hypothetical protein
MSDMQCPASMCPLIAPNGSPWTQDPSPCPGHGDIDFARNDPRCGCPWWVMACATGGIQKQVERADRADGEMLVVGPNQPRRLRAAPRSYDCPKASTCRWQEIAGDRLCPPRDALARGLDPRVTLF